LKDEIEAVYRAESGRVLASLIRLLGGFELAEEALHDAFMAAAEQWPKTGVPANPRTWLVSAGRFRAIDRIRRRTRFGKIAVELRRQLEDEMAEPAMDEQSIADDTLRLIFTCCHPALPADAQTAMTLREVCGLTTEEIAHAFLAAPSAIAQRIVRAKQKIRDQAIPYEVPERPDMPERLQSVLRAIYLVFNEGYLASSGDSVTRADLQAEAIRLGRLLVELLPEPEAEGLLALMLLSGSRRTARATPDGDIILLADQDRSLWDRAMIAEGGQLAEKALRNGKAGPYAIQAAISAVHAGAATPADTDWSQIVELYTLLMQAAPSAIVELNRAVAIAERDGPAAGLALIDAILARGDLANYHLSHAARADLLRRLNRPTEARAAYLHALELAQQEPEKRFLRDRIEGLSG
jgi:RNA polymerase sigma-70 factor (ECF subfamily)